MSFPSYYPLMTARGIVKLFPQWESFKKGSELGSGPAVTLSYVFNNWEDGDAVVNALVGGGIGVPPAACPTSPNLLANSAWIEGRGEIVDFAGGMPRFSLVVCVVNYGIRLWEGSISEDPAGNHSFPNSDNPGQPYTFANQRISYGSETIKLPDGLYHFRSTLKKTTVPVITTVGVATLVFTKKFVSSLPTTLILSMNNKLNLNPLFGAPKGHFRFSGASTTKEFISDGGRVQEIEMTFMWREQEWNAYHREDVQGWDIIADDFDSPPLGYADLSQLLTM